MSTSPTSADTAAGDLPAGRTDSGDLRPGQNLGRYRILRLIAKGGMANVYLATHLELEVTRALKVLKPGFSDEARARLKTEAKISANLHHPNIIQLYGLASEDQPMPFLEMEYVDGWSLTEILQRAKPLPVPVALSIAIFVCRALGYAHHQRVTLYGQVYEGLVHRDIKPGNIMLSRSGDVKLADFGIARPGGSTIHTVDSKVMGTFAYLSPEQLTETRLDQRSDIYSLGAVTYEMLSGSKLFPHSNLVEIVQSKSHGNYRDLQSANPGMTPEICRIVDKSIQLDKTKRFSSAAEFANALGRALRRHTELPPEAIVREFIENPQPAKPAAVRVKTARYHGLFLVLLVSVAAGVLLYAAFLVNRPAPAQHRTAVAATAGTSAPAAASPAVPAPTTRRQAPPSAPSAPAATRTALASAPAAASAPADAQSSMNAGLRAFDAGRYAAAAAALETVPLDRLQPQDRDLLTVRLLGCYLQTGELAKAREWARAHPLDDGYCHLLQGIASYRLDDLVQAQRSLEAALTTPSRYSDDVREQATYYWARVRTAVYQAKPNTDNRARARTAWDNYTVSFCGDDTKKPGCDEAQRARAELGTE